MRHAHLGHSSTEHPPEQLTRKIWDNHIHIDTATQVDGQREWGVKMGTTEEAKFIEI